MAYTIIIPENGLQEQENGDILLNNISFEMDTGEIYNIDYGCLEADRLSDVDGENTEEKIKILLMEIASSYETNKLKSEDITTYYDNQIIDDKGNISDFDISMEE